jgi:hypothetical protein
VVDFFAGGVDGEDDGAGESLVGPGCDEGFHFFFPRHGGRWVTEVLEGSEESVGSEVGGFRGVGLMYFSSDNKATVDHGLARICSALTSAIQTSGSTDVRGWSKMNGS